MTTAHGGGKCMYFYTPVPDLVEPITVSYYRCSEVGWAQVGPPAGVNGIVSKHFTVQDYSVRSPLRVNPRLRLTISIPN